MTIVPFQAQPPASPRQTLVHSMDDVFTLAETVANTDFVPRGLRGNQPAIIAAILYGREVGLEPMQSLAKISVIDGRPTLSSEAQRALILAAGHEWWIEESTNARAIVCGRRRNDKTTSRVTWTMDDAKRANLAGRKNWQTYPRQMLLARASAELARAIFADVIGGLAATEEFDADTPPPDVPDASVPEPEPAKTTTRRRRKPPAAPPEEAPADTTPPDPATDGQLRAVMARFREMGLADEAQRDARLAFASEAVGRPLASSRDLTTVEAATVLHALDAALEARREGEVEQALVTEVAATEVTDTPSAFTPPADVQQELETREARGYGDDFPPGF